MEYSDRVKEFEEELKNTKYNKKTQHAIGLLKAKISNLGKGQIVCISAKNTFDLIKNEIIPNPNFLIKKDEA